MKVLVIEDKKNYLELIKDILDSENIKNDGVLTGKEGLKKIKKERYSIIISDLFLPDIDGFEIIKKVKKIYPEIPIIMITAFGSVERAVQAIKLGAYDFIPKPFEPEHLIFKIRKAMEEEKLKTENLIYKAKEGETKIIGESNIIKELLQKLEKVASTDATVLLQGESGTGKELFARKLHELSNRKNNPFISINCAAIPEKLLETELFGYEKGAFTGAYKTKQGKLELAHQGTVFLDEIGDLPIELQPKLLKVIEEKSFERVGGTEQISSDIRLVFATNKDLKKEVKEGRFREDLYFRIAVFPIVIPPLRERREDISLLVNYFIDKISRRIKKKIDKIDKKAFDKIMEYRWSGNIRELQNTIERAIILSNGGIIKGEEILLEQEKETIDLSGKLKVVLENIEKIKIKKALEQYKDKNKAAEALGLTYKTLQMKIKKYNIKF
jgi:DNA-binding NtrC family response regulator